MADQTFSQDEINRIIGELFNTADPSRSELSPQQNGEFRLSPPSNVKVANAGTFAWGGSHYVISWQDVEDQNIKGYRIYYSDAAAQQTGASPTLVGGSTISPAHINVSVPVSGAIIFWVQPYLASGLELPLSACPTCSVTAPSGTYEIMLVDLATGDHITVKIDNDLPSGGGGTTTGVGVYDTTDGRHSNLAAAFLEILNGNAKGVASIAAQTTALSTPGIVRVFDGSGAGSLGSGQTVILDGSNGKISIYGGAGRTDITSTTGIAVQTSSGIVGVPTTSATSLTIVVGGTTYRIPLFI